MDRYTLYPQQDKTCRRSKKEVTEGSNEVYRKCGVGGGGVGGDGYGVGGDGYGSCVGFNGAEPDSDNTICGGESQQISYSEGELKGGSEVENTPCATRGGNMHTKKKKDKKPVLGGSRRTLFVLSCLFITQVMSTLPIFLLFLLVYFSENTNLIPSLETTTFLTTLLVCNTGINPVVRIIIKPMYNNLLIKGLLDIWCRVRAMLILLMSFLSRDS